MRKLLIPLGLILLASCGGGDGGGGTGPETVASVTISPGAQMNLQVGQTQQLTASVVGTAGHTLGDRPIAWSSTQTRVGSVNAGLVTALDSGSAKIIASAEGKADTVTLAVSLVPVASLELTPDAATLDIGGTQQLTVTLRDAAGNVLTGRAVTFGTTDATKAQVSPTGLVTAVAAGTAKIGATSEGKSDTTIITVRSSTSSTCAPGSGLSLAVGQVRLLTGAERSALCVGGGAAGAEFTLIPVHASTSPAATVQLEFQGDQITTVSGPPTPLAARAAAGPSLLRDEARSAIVAAEFEARFRAMERRELTPRLAAARAELARRATSLSASRAALAVPNVGDLLTFNTAFASACTSPVFRTGRVVAVTQRAVVVADTGNPTGGFTDAEYQSFGVTFDTLIYAVDIENFGTPRDIDNNGGRVVILFSRAVNVLSPPNSGATVFGFAAARDHFPKTGSGSCAGSNEAEMFYLFVPDPTGVVNGRTFTKDFVKQTIFPTLGHEMEHLINASLKVANPQATSFEEGWLDEGLAHTAEELMFYRAGNTSPRRNLDLPTLASSARLVDAFNTFQLDDFLKLDVYLRNPEAFTPYATEVQDFTQPGTSAARGSAWQLLRYTADRKGGTESALWRSLVNTSLHGLTNLTTQSGIAFTTLIRDWAIAQYTDDAGFTAAPQYTHPSWNFRSIYPGLGNHGPFALKVRPLADGQSQTLTLVGGGAAYVRFGVAASATGSIRTTSQGQAPPAVVELALVRTK